MARHWERQRPLGLKGGGSLGEDQISLTRIKKEKKWKHRWTLPEKTAESKNRVRSSGQQGTRNRGGATIVKKRWINSRGGRQPTNAHSA